MDGDHQVIVAIGVSNQASDAVHLLPMLEGIQANSGRLPEALIADAVTARKDDAPAADQAATINVAGSMAFSGGGGLIQTTPG